jgi:hypothetical protein
MALRSNLALWCYTAPGAPVPVVLQDYGASIEGLEFTTVAPGGFGDLACIVKLPDARIPRPELGLFSRAVLKDGLFTAFSGEWADPALVLDATHGEYVLLSALGGGVALRDDPDDSNYSGKTASQIMTSEFAKRSNYLALDSDLSAFLPTNPATIFSPAYDGYNLEELLGDLMANLGDYTWSVWDHPTHDDQMGLPTWRLEAHPRDTTTTHYTAYLPDILAWRVAPSAQRAYNVVQVCYTDTNTGPAQVTVTDTRLADSGAQSLAPFRRRKLRQGLGRMPLTSTQATQIANAWLAQYQSITNKVEVELSNVRDGYGNVIPLHQVRADRNLYVPELAVRGQQLSSGPVPGTNQFYIVETSYRETAAGDVRLVLQLDNYADKGAALVSQLKLAYDASRRARGSIQPVVSVGVPVVVPCGATFTNETGGATVRIVVPWGAVLAKAPTSVALSSVGSTNASSITANTPTIYGFTLQWTVTAGGATAVSAVATSVGN